MNQSWILSFEESMTITWNDSALFKGFTDKLLNYDFIWVLAFVKVFKIHHPFKAFLSDETEEWPC